MVVDLDMRAGDGAASTARAGTTPLAAAPAPASARFPHAALTVLAVAAAVVAGLAHLTGASPILTGAVALLAAANVFFLLRVWRRENRRAEAIGMRAARSRDELEVLSDRMWELQESEERLLGLIDTLGDLVVHRDRDGRIVYANRVFADLLAGSAKEPVGRTLPELGIEVGMVPDAAFADGECLSSKDVQIETAEGPRWFSWIELSVRDAATGAGSHRAIARDITSRKRAEVALISARERAELASRAKSRFLATVSHEIRTPMNGIMGMARLLAETQLSQEQRTYVGAVSTSATALLALIEDLLDFSKIEAGRLEIEMQPVRPRELIENVTELLAARAYGKDIGLGCHVDPAVPVTFASDPGRLRQVLLNLVGNAIKFTDTGGVLVAATLGSIGDQPALVVTVRDSGPGLERADLERIFHEFEQADGTSTRRHGGAGLGLSISRRIIEAMGGTLRVESTPGIGSEFSFAIPLRGATPSEPDRTVLAGHAVLIVSANTMEAEAIAMSLAALGAGTDIARTPEEAIASAPAGKAYDAVVVDAGSETIAGRVLGKLREAGTVSGPAFILVAPSDRGRLAEYRTAGYASFLPRPVRGDTLLRMIVAGFESEPVEGAGMSRKGTAQRRGGAPRLSVLLAEDNEINALLARTALVKAGHAVKVVANGRAAVDAATGGGAFDVVLMDLHMPVMDGLDAIALIRRHEEERGVRPVPIMVLSADGQEKTRHQVLAHGASGFIAKPIDPEALVHAVRDHAAASCRGTFKPDATRVMFL